MLQSIFIFIILLGLAPLLAGAIPLFFMEREKRCLGLLYVSGFLLLLACFQLIGVPIVFKDPWGFEPIVTIYSVITIGLCVSGILLVLVERFRKKRTFFPEQTRGVNTERSWIWVVEWALVLGLIGFQLWIAFSKASFDGDDAYYVVMSLLTDETDTLYRIKPYTGLSTYLDYRHSMAVFPIWIAYIARVTGIHTTIVCHTFLPFVLIPMTYWIYYEIGKSLLGKGSKNLPAFLILVNLCQIFGNTSIYTNATFLLTRTWQGKSVLANLIIPTLFCIFLWMFQENTEQKSEGKFGNAGLWLLLFLLNIVAAMTSTASVFLMSLTIALMALCLSIAYKNYHLLWKFALTCLPCVGYGLLYMSI